jgi:hypothetical protein
MKRRILLYGLLAGVFAATAVVRAGLLGNLETAQDEK